MFLFKILFNQVFNILFFERIYTIMNTIYLFSIIILIFLIMIFKSIQYYYFLKDKQNLYVLIKKKYAIWNSPNFIDYIKFTLYFYPKQNPTCIHLTFIN